MNVYPVVPVLNKFRQAIKALLESKNLKADKVKLSNAWEIVESAIKANSADFEALREYESLVDHIKSNEFVRVQTWDLNKKK